MFQKILFLTSIAAVFFSCANVASAQAGAADTAKIKSKITKLGVGSNITVVERGGNTFHGSIGQIGDDSFTVSEVDLKANVEIRYDQVKHLDKGYTQASPITGQRMPPKAHKIIGFAALGAAIVAIVVLIVALRDPNF